MHRPYRDPPRCGSIKIFCANLLKCRALLPQPRILWAEKDYVAERMGIELAVRFSKNAFEMSGEFRLIVPKMAT